VFRLHAGLNTQVSSKSQQTVTCRADAKRRQARRQAAQYTAVSCDKEAVRTPQRVCQLTRRVSCAHSSALSGPYCKCSARRRASSAAGRVHVTQAKNMCRASRSARSAAFARAPVDVAGPGGRSSVKTLQSRSVQGLRATVLRKADRSCFRVPDARAGSLCCTGVPKVGNSAGEGAGGVSTVRRRFEPRSNA
jgi:hypothetical protein